MFRSPISLLGNIDTRLPGNLMLLLVALLLPFGRSQGPLNVPAVDLSKHSVPLSEIYFDTFQPVNRAVPLDQAAPELIKALQDAIPPISNPKYESPAAAAAWLGEEDLVLGYAVGEEAWAYPINIMNFHEIVNDTLAGEPVLVSYCPLCFSGIVYSRRLNGQVLTFGNTSALYESDLVMLDYQTGSYWWQVAGEAIVGTLTGERLTPLPSTTTTFGEWLELYPDTLVLSRDTGFFRPYERNPFAGYAEVVNSGRFPFPVSEAGRDVRLPPATKVLLVRLGDEARAYPLTAESPVVTHDLIDDTEVLVLVDPERESGAVFLPETSGRSLRFKLSEGVIIDQETGSRWDRAGRATGGPLAGSSLTALPSKTSFWFAAVAAEPGVTVFVPEGE